MARTYQTELEFPLRKRIKCYVAQMDVSEGFQQATGEIFQAPVQLPGRSSKLGRRGTQQTAYLQDLQNDVRICSK